MKLIFWSGGTAAAAMAAPGGRKFLQQRAKYQSIPDVAGAKQYKWRALASTECTFTSNWRPHTLHDSRHQQNGGTAFSYAAAVYGRGGAARENHITTLGDTCTCMRRPDGGYEHNTMLFRYKEQLLYSSWTRGNMQETTAAKYTPSSHHVNLNILETLFSSPSASLEHD